MEDVAPRETNSLGKECTHGSRLYLRARMRSVAQVIEMNHGITFGGSRISRGVPVGHTDIRVMKLRRVLREETSAEALRVRPSKPSSSLIFNE
jgi:hypothetical protein